MQEEVEEPVQAHDSPLPRENTSRHRSVLVLDTANFLAYFPAIIYIFFTIDHFLASCNRGV